jgi:hypothetical protein
MRPVIGRVARANKRCWFVSASSRGVVVVVHEQETIAVTSSSRRTPAQGGGLRNAGLAPATFMQLDRRGGMLLMMRVIHLALAMSLSTPVAAFPVYIDTM